MATPRGARPRSLELGGERLRLAETDLVGHQRISTVTLKKL